MCRSFLSVWKDENGKEVQSGRMNLGVVSLNLPRIAIESNGDIDVFWELLEERVELCHRALQYRIKSVCSATPRSAPTLYMNGAFGKYLKENETVKQLFENGRASISLGYIGVSETVKLLLGLDALKGNTTAHNLGIDIVQFLRDKCDTWKHKEGWGYSLYGTPAESLCRTWLAKDRAEFGVIKGITDKEYYYNSFHVPVDEDFTPSEKIEWEAPFHFISSGGHITYIEGPRMVDNLKGLELFIDLAMDKLDYFGFNAINDKCYECGTEGEFTPTAEGYVCPKCGNKDQMQMSVIRRICGYLGNINVRPVNDGKAQEFLMRVKHVKRQ